MPAWPSDLTCPPFDRLDVQIMLSSPELAGHLLGTSGHKPRQSQRFTRSRREAATGQVQREPPVTCRRGRRVVRNLEDKCGKPGRWVVADPLPEAVDLLPDPAQLARPDNTLDQKVAQNVTHL